MTYRSILICLFLSLPLVAARQASQQNLIDEIRKFESEYGGHAGFMAKNLNTGETVGLNQSERFPTASVIKLPVMAAFFSLVDGREVNPDARLTLTGEDKKGGSGILQYLSEGSTITLLDAVRLMIVLSDNTATNLVLDRLAPTHAERMRKVNEYLVGKEFKNTRILNRLYSLETKQGTPEAIRYGIGVSTPEDMVKLLEALHAKTLASPASCDAMLAILKHQFYADMIPRFLPREGCKVFEVADKTGFVNETKVDVGLILSDRVNIAIAIFVDKHPDHRDIANNHALLLTSYIARAVWNHFTGDTGYEQRPTDSSDVDWNSFPGGRWGIYRSAAALFPHTSRENGHRLADGTVFPYHPHYDDRSVVVAVPSGFHETREGTNIIVHFHGHMNDNLEVLERYGMPQALTQQKINALLVLPQGPYRAKDSSGGKMEEDGGLKALVDDVLATMKKEDVVKTTRLNKVIVSAHSGGYWPAAHALEKGGLADRVSDVFLFDAFYSCQEYFGKWLTGSHGFLHAAYTDHLAPEHLAFEKGLTGEPRQRLTFTHTSVNHDQVIQSFFAEWLGRLDPGWKMDAR